MLILGLDPGSRATGYGLVEKRGVKLRPVAHGTFRPPRGLSFLERLPYIADALEEVLRRMRPEAAAAEDIFLARNSRAAIKLGHVRGAALLPLLRAGVPVYEYPARLVKRSVTGYGGAEKEQVRHMVRLLLGLGQQPLPLDASDALAVAICHAHATDYCRRPRGSRTAATA